MPEEWDVWETWVSFRKRLESMCLLCNWRRVIVASIQTLYRELKIVRRGLIRLDGHSLRNHLLHSRRAIKWSDLPLVVHYAILNDVVRVVGAQSGVRASGLAICNRLSPRNQTLHSVPRFQLYDNRFSHRFVMHSGL